MPAPTRGPAPGHAVRVGLLLGPALFVLALFVPLPDLTAQGKAVVATHTTRVAMGLALWMAAWWMTEALPLAATSLLPLAVLAPFGVLPSSKVAAAYFDDSLALFLGGFCLALAMEKSGLHRRFALAVLRIFGTRPRRIVLGFLAASAAISMWVSNTATTLMLMPVAATVIATTVAEMPERRNKAERNFAAACVLAVAYGASIGGVGTVIGTPPNILLLRHVQGLGEGMPALTFSRWLVVGVPVVLALVPLCWILLVRFALPVPIRLHEGDVERRPSTIVVRPKPTFAHTAVLVTFVLTAIGWITRQPVVLGDWHVPGTGWEALFPSTPDRKPFVTDGTIAIVATLVLFLCPSREKPGDRLLTWEYVHARLPWGALLLFGGGFSLAESFKDSGLSAYLTAAFAGLHSMPPFLLVLVVVAGVTLVSEVASNTATTSMLLPIVGPVAVGAGLPVLPLLFAVTLGASCGFALPVATMPNTIAYGTGCVTAPEMGRAGWRLDLVGILVMTAAVLWLVPLAFPGSS